MLVWVTSPELTRVNEKQNDLVQQIWRHGHVLITCHGYVHPIMRGYGTRAPVSLGSLDSQRFESCKTSRMHQMLISSESTINFPR